MEKKAQRNGARSPKPLKLNKVTILLLESSDLAQVAGGQTRSLCVGTTECCDFW